MAWSCVGEREKFSGHNRFIYTWLFPMFGTAASENGVTIMPEDSKHGAGWVEGGKHVYVHSQSCLPPAVRCCYVCYVCKLWQLLRNELLTRGQEFRFLKIPLEVDKVGLVILLLLKDFSFGLTKVFFSFLKSSESFLLLLLHLVVYGEIKGPKKSAVVVYSASGLPEGRM